MIQWGVVAAFVGPLLAGMGGIAGWFAWAAKKRDVRVAQQIREATAPMVVNQQLMQQQIEIMNVNQQSLVTRLDRQDTALTQAMQGLARIEGRLSGMPGAGSISGAA